MALRMINTKNFRLGLDFEVWKIHSARREKDFYTDNGIERGTFSANDECAEFANVPRYPCSI